MLPIPYRVTFCDANGTRGEGYDASEDGTGRGTPLVPVGVTIHGTDGTARVASYDELAQCLRARTPGNIDNSSTTVVQQPVAFSIMPMNSGKDYKARQTDVAQPLMAGGPVGGNQGGDFIAQAVAVRTANTGANGHGISPECAHTLDRAQGQAVAFAQNTRDEVRLMGGDGSIVGALTAQPGTKQQCYVAVAFSQNQLGEVRAGSVFNTINTNSNASGRNTPMVAYPLDLRNALRDPEKHDEQNRQGCGLGEDGDPAPTLTKAHVHGVATTTAVPQPMAFDACNQGVDVAGTMKACKDSGGWSNSADRAAAGYMQPVLTPVRYGDHQQDTLHHESGIMSTLPGGTKDNASHYTKTVQAMQVRRLTPTECERLQGFPDGYTLVPHRGKPAADGPRYKSLGNSMAVPVMAWIGKRIDQAIQ